VFEQIAGLPAHPLLIHAAVVFIPLLALGSAAYALVPRLRRQIRWVVGLLALAGAGSAVLARFSGEAFEARLIRKKLASPEILDAVERHEQFGTVTMWVTLALATVVLVTLWAMPPRTARAGDGDLAPASPTDADHGAAPVGGAGPPGAGLPGAGPHTAGATVTRLASRSSTSPARAVTTQRTAGTAVTVILAVLTIALAATSLYYVYRTGDSGAHIVWSGF
jgi:hypothetical protein